MKKYIDTHAHYGHGRFRTPTDQILEQMKNYTERIIQVGTNTKSNSQTISLINNYDYLYGMVGYFPTDVWEIDIDLSSSGDKNWNLFIKQLDNKKIVGIGEIGLDYSWNRVGDLIVGQDAQNVQKKWFKKQLDLAKEFDLPVSIHSRDAEADTLAIFDEYELIPGVIHCFSYGRSAAKRAIDKGLYIGIGGTSTYPSNHELREVIKMIPLDRILLETDAPYLSPQIVRKDINTSENIKYVIQNIADIKGIACDDVVDITNQNAMLLFQRLS
jgi:TatD DNase family protein